MKTVEEVYRIDCLKQLKESIDRWDIHRDDDNELSKEEGYLLWRLTVSIEDLKEFYERNKD